MKYSLIILVVGFWASQCVQAQSVSVIWSAAGAQIATDSLVELLNADGYLDASIVENNGVPSIARGVQYRLSTMSIIGDDNLVLSFDTIFTKVVVASYADLILKSYLDSGYYYATLEVVSIERKTGKVDLTMSLNKGPKVSFGKFIFRGLKRTRVESLIRYLQIKQDEFITSEFVARLYAQSRSIPHLNFTGAMEIIPKSGYTEADIVLGFEERQPVTIQAGGGYLSAEKKLLWSVDLQFVNLFGSGREARFYSERREQGRNHLTMSYSQPTRLLRKGELSFEAATRDYRDAFYEFKVAGAIGGQLKRDMRSRLTLRFRSVEPSGSGASSSIYTVGLQTDFIHQDFPLNPTSGFWFKTRLEFSSRHNSADTSSETSVQTLTETRASADVGSILPIGQSAALKLRVNYVGLETPEELPPLSELVLVGGPGTLRGFRNEQFAVLRMAVGTFEPRLRFPTGYFFSFVDAAYMNNREIDDVDTIRSTDQFEVGYGAGMYLSDRGRAVKLSLSWNPDVSFDQPRISIELIADI